MHGFDTQTKEAFDERRFKRLKETISEYLDDEGQSYTKFLEDLERALLENSQYFSSRASVYNRIQEYLFTQENN